MTAKVVAPAILSLASFIASFALPIAFPHLAPWVGLALLVGATCLAFLAAGLFIGDYLAKARDASSIPISAPPDFQQVGERVMPKPDLPLNAVLIRLYKKRGPLPEDDGAKQQFRRKIDLEIGDAVAHEGLHVWGRLGVTPLRLIPATVWNRGLLAHQSGCFRVQNPDTGRIQQYDDITFNTAEVDEWLPA